MEDAPPPSSEPPSKYPAGSLRELLAVAVPLAVSTGSVSVAQVVDRAFLTRFDPDALAAVMPAGMLHWALMSPFLGVAMTVNTFVAQGTAAGRRGEAAAAVWQGVLVAACAGVAFLLLAPLAPAVFALAGHAPAVERFEAEYFSVLCLGGLPTVASFALAGWHGGRGQTGVVMAVNIALAVVNVVLDRILIFGWGPIPAFGVGGAAAATGLAFAFACGLYLVLLSREAGFLAAWRVRWGLMRRLLKFGVPTGLHYLADVAALTVFLLLVGRLGADGLAATSLTFNLNSLCFLPAVGLGSAASILVGHRVGEGRPHLAVRTGWLAAGVGGAGMLASGVLFWFFPGPLIDLYVGDGASFTEAELGSLYAVAPTLLKFVAAYSLFDVLAVVLGGAVRGAGDTTFPLVWTAACAWALMVAPTAAVVWWEPLTAAVLGEGRALSERTGVVAAWGCAAAYIGVCGLGMAARFAGGKWRGMTVLEPEFKAEGGGRKAEGTVV